MAKLGGSKPVEQEKVAKSVRLPFRGLGFREVMLLFSREVTAFNYFDGLWKQAVHFKTQLKLYLIGSPGRGNRQG